MASIRKKVNKSGSVSWQVRWRDPDGKSRARNFATKRAASAHAVEVESAKNHGNYRDPDAGRITFEAYAREWLRIQTFSATTQEAVAGRLRLHVFPHIGSIPLRAITPTRIQGLVKILERTEVGGNRAVAASGEIVTLSPRYIRTILANVTTVLNAALADGKVAKNPATAPSVRPPKVQLARVRPWTFEQVAAVRDALPAPYQVIVMLAAGCGLRQGEIFGLAVEDIDFLRGTVHVRRQVKIVGSRLVYGLPKGDKARDVPLPEVVRDAISLHLRDNEARSCPLPWNTPDGAIRTFDLLLSGREGRP